jgi:hypothetical protein
VDAARFASALLGAILAGAAADARAFGEPATPADAPAIAANELPSLGAGEKPAAPRWDRALPFGAQKVIDLGFELPNPYETGATYFSARQLIALSNLGVAFNGAPFHDASFVGFPQTKVNNRALQVQAGAWVFPFLNVFGLVGRIKGDGNIQVDVPGSGLAEFVGLDTCARPPALQPEFCGRTFTGHALSTFTGNNYGIGFTLAGMYKGIFVAIPVARVVAEVVSQGAGGGNKNQTKTLNVAPRAGMTLPLGQGHLTVYGGATYLSGDFSIDGNLQFDTSGTSLGDTLNLAYRISGRPADKWNYLAGAHWAISRNWSLMTEIGFGESRSNVIVAGFYRF